MFTLSGTCENYNNHLSACQHRFVGLEWVQHIRGECYANNTSEGLSRDEPRTK